MKTTINRIELLEGLKKLGHFIDSKTKLPILSGVKITTTENNTLQLIAGNQDAMASVVIDTLQTETSGSLVLEYKKLNDFLKKSKALDIEIDMLVDNKANIKASNIDYKLMFTDANKYPLLPSLEYERMTMDVNEYRRMINNTTFAVAKSESRPVLKGVCVRTDNYNHIDFVATDSHRLGRYTVPSQLDNIDTVIDGKTLEKSVKMLNKKTESIEIGFNQDFTIVQFDNVELCIKNIEGNYPDFSRLIPEDFRTEAIINSSQLVESIDMLKTIAKDDHNHAVKMQLNGKIEMLAESFESGLMTANIEGEKTGEDLKIAMSAIYLNEAVKAINEENTQFKFTGSMRPFIALSNDNKAMQLILPVRIA
ncbi:DNA polymerase III subunit beta [Lysinibacillus agricola]|uniref:Beta sliding clamp n=1 Tax=Lysinibacillus agricola TaxID=2590012 RepID=A0ABX7AMY1_9BACI|nr:MULTISPECIES: DNA polymerase III subunit beta [Lysinibacillus]KOS61462.1 hypothetical protein AN161_17885 [Lysinibacillus sp. FJAT-14222]QQP10856.1 DNA polymerase III subunit beta [Lysinibacillus agricola]